MKLIIVAVILLAAVPLTSQAQVRRDATRLELSFGAVRTPTDGFADHRFGHSERLIVARRIAARTDVLAHVGSESFGHDGNFISNELRQDALGQSYAGGVGVRQYVSAWGSHALFAQADVTWLQSRVTDRGTEDPRWLVGAGLGYAFIPSFSHAGNSFALQANVRSLEGATHMSVFLSLWFGWHRADDI
jgi:hypothetical protein